MSKSLDEALGAVSKIGKLEVVGGSAVAERKTIDLGSMLWHAENLLNLADDHNQLMKEKRAFQDQFKATAERWDENSRKNSEVTK